MRDGQPQALDLLRCVRDDASLTAHEKAVLNALVLRASSPGDDVPRGRWWTCFPSLNTICRDSGLGRSSVSVALKALDASGRIERSHRPGPGRGVLYRLCVDALRPNIRVVDVRTSAPWPDDIRDTGGRSSGPRTGSAHPSAQGTVDPPNPRPERAGEHRARIADWFCEITGAWLLEAHGTAREEMLKSYERGEAALVEKIVNWGRGKRAVAIDGSVRLEVPPGVPSGFKRKDVVQGLRRAWEKHQQSSSGEGE